MRRIAAAVILFAASWVFVQGSSAAGPAPRKVLIVMDEREQMEVLALYLKMEGEIESTIVDQAHLPSDWSSYHAVIGYIHGKLDESAELKFIDYTKKGGRFIALHHTISSGKARNRYFFDFLGVELPGADKAREPTVPGGHYAWLDPVDQVLVNLHPSHYITGHSVTWPTRASYVSSDAPSVEREYPAAVLKGTEVYVNHKFTDGRAKTVLVGFKWTDDRNGQLYMQDRILWYKKQEKGWLFYFEPGHFADEFRNRLVAQIILNMILWQPVAE